MTCTDMSDTGLTKPDPVICPGMNRSIGNLPGKIGDFHGIDFPEEKIIYGVSDLQG